MCVPSPRGRLAHNVRRFGHTSQYHQEVAAHLREPVPDLTGLRERRNEALKVESEKVGARTRLGRGRQNDGTESMIIVEHPDL